MICSQDNKMATSDEQTDTPQKAIDVIADNDKAESGDPSAHAGTTIEDDDTTKQGESDAYGGEKLLDF